MNIVHGPSMQQAWQASTNDPSLEKATVHPIAWRDV